MPGLEGETTDSVRKQIQRHVNCLSDDVKITRKKGLMDLRKDVITRQLGGTLLQEIALEVLKPTLKCLSDSSEKNRELATSLISDYISVIPSPDQTLSYVIPTLVQRLAQKEITEPSEELRLQLLNDILMPCIEYSGKKIAGYLDELIQILQKTILDPYAEVKKSSCSLACKISKTIPEYFHMQSESLIKPLMMTITHQHSKVRVAVIEATADVIQFGNGKSVDDVISHLAQRFFDPSSQVRMCVTRMIGRWLIELPDRYSFFYKFIPLILTSFNDEMPDIRKEARELWHKAGILYEEENEKDLKDKLDFMQPLPLLYPKGVDRPCLGCRELVHRNLSKLTTAIIRDLDDWVAETRQKTAQLLYELLIHAEEYTTQHMQPLVQALIKACSDDQPIVQTFALKCASLIGAFVKPEVFCSILLQNVQLHYGAAPPMLVLAAAINGCSDDVLGDKLTEIMELLISEEVCQASEKSVYHHALLECVGAIVEVCKPRVQLVSLHLFTIVITVAALNGKDDIEERCNNLFSTIAGILNVTVEDLFGLHTKQVLDNMGASYQSWTVYSLEQQVFDALLSKAGSVVGQVLDEVMPMLESNLKQDKDPELKLRLFTLLSKLLVNANSTVDSQKQFSSDHVRSIAMKMVAPNLVWKAGHKCAAVRSMAIATLWALLKSGLPSKDDTLHFFPLLLPQLTSSLEDDVKTTRLTAAKVLTRLFNVCGTELDLDEILHKLYLELLKRMDDASDEIRMCVTRTWIEYFKCFPSEYDSSLYRAHLECMYAGLLIHMDDPSTDIQLAVLDVLKLGGRLSPALLRVEVEKVKHKHRTPAYCEQLLHHFQH